MSTTLQPGKNLSPPVTTRQFASTNPTRWLVWNDISVKWEPNKKTSLKFQAHSRDIYHTKRMQRLTAIAWSLDDRFIYSGSDEMNIRIWKARAAEKLGVVSYYDLNFKFKKTVSQFSFVSPRSNPERNQLYELMQSWWRNSPTIQRSNGSTVIVTYLNTSSTPGTKCGADELQPSGSA